MSALSGSSLIYKSCRFAIEDSSDAGVPRRHAANLADDFQFDETDKGRLGIVINELCSNLLQHARRGEIIIRPRLHYTLAAIEILSIDRGPGIDDIPVAMKDGFSTGSTPGNGLGAVARQSSYFDIYSESGKGTVILSIIHAGAPVKNPPPTFQVGAICLPIEGEAECGDGWYFKQTPEKITVLVADGLGHGLLAHQASALAIELCAQRNKETLEQTMQVLNQNLRSTRGAAVSICDIHLQTQQLQFVGIGNVLGSIVVNGAMKSLVSHSGTVGIQVRAAKTFAAKWSEESLLILHSDGMLSRWNLEAYPGVFDHHPSILCALLYRDFNRNNDDITIFVGGIK